MRRSNRSLWITYFAVAAITLIVFLNNGRIESSIVSSVGLVTFAMFESATIEGASKNYVLVNTMAFFMCFVLFALPASVFYGLGRAVSCRRAAIGCVLAWAILFVGVLVYV